MKNFELLLEEKLGIFFKPEVKTSGLKLVEQDKISLSSYSDTTIQAYVRVSPSLKVIFLTSNIANPSFSASCSCPASKKNLFCKHIWATLICVEKFYPDFLSAKSSIEKPTEIQSAFKNSYQEASKQRASEYRKEQYQKQKLRAKDFKNQWSKKKEKKDEDIHIISNYPPEVEAAFAYFLANGFAMLPNPTGDALSEAKRKLARVFHPDRGGSHDEAVELNKNCELIENFLNTR